MSSPVVSIVTPAYNAAPFIGTTIESVLAQSYPCWEWIIVDDGSTDATTEIVSNCRDPRVRLVRAKHSGLPAAARNVGLSLAQGQLVAFLDADDLWEPNKLTLQVQYLAQHPHVGLVWSRYYVWVDQHKRPRQIVPATRGIPNPGNMLSLLCLENRIGTSSVLARRKYLVSCGGFDENQRLRGVEDYDLWLRLAARCLFGFLEQPLYWYRLHAANISGGEARIQERRIIAVERALARHPELRAAPGFSGAEMSARKLCWQAQGLLKDGVGDCGFGLFLRSLRLRPHNPAAWTGLALSTLGPGTLGAARRLARRLW
jgi:glycosyltransferase involved in cell wall biosynthesis